MKSVEELREILFSDPLVQDLQTNLAIRNMETFLARVHSEYAGDAETLREYIQNGAAVASAGYEILSAIEAEYYRSTSLLSVEKDVAFMTRRADTSTKGKSYTEADSTAFSTQKTSGRRLELASLGAARKYVSLKLEAVTRLVASLEACLRSLTEEIKAFRG